MKSNFIKAFAIAILTAFAFSSCESSGEIIPDGGTDSGEVIPVKSITFSEELINITVGESYMLTPILTPYNATADFRWESLRTNIATVDNNGIVTAHKVGSTRISVYSNYNGAWAYCEVSVTEEKNTITFDFNPSGIQDGHKYIDLGLSVKWATENIGARSMEEFGEYYAWGEHTPYNKELTYINYGWSFPPCSPDAVLSSIFDTATELWGESWRMPTGDELKELIDNCTWVWVDNMNYTASSGYVAVSKKNGKCIFLPATKWMSSTTVDPKENDGFYWASSTLSTAGKYNFQAGSTAEGLKFVSNPGMVAPVEMSYLQMGNGATIRPVLGTPNYYYPDPDDITVDTAETDRQGISVSGKVDGYTYVDLGFPSRTLWATYNVGANLPAEYGDYFAWGETSPKSSYTYDNYKFFAGYSDSKEPLTQYTKYVWHKDHGTPDAKFMLDPEDDTASVNWSKNWCMPSYEQIQELADLCDFWRKDIVVNGKKVIGFIGESKLNGNRIYLPAAGWEYANVTNSHLSIEYWATDISRKSSTQALFFTYREETGLLEVVDGFGREQGLTVRPVVK